MNPHEVYKRTKVETSNPLELIVMAYDAIIKNLYKAIEEIGKKSYMEANSSISKAQDILTELISALDMEKGGDIAKNLYSIYIYCHKRLFEGNIEKNPEYLKEVINILGNIKEAWEILARNYKQQTINQQKSSEKDIQKPKNINIST